MSEIKIFEDVSNQYSFKELGFSNYYDGEMALSNMLEYVKALNAAEIPAFISTEVIVEQQYQQNVKVGMQKRLRYRVAIGKIREVRKNE